MNQPKRKRRFFSFSLRTLLFCMLLVACLFGWVGIRYRRALEQREILDRIRASGAHYIYIGDEYCFPSSREFFFDGNYINRIDYVFYNYFKDRPLTNLEPLTALKNLKRLDLEDKLVTDIGPLAELKNLEELNLVSTDVTNLAPLAGLKNLKILGLAATPVTNLSPLAKLKNLRRLDLYGTDVTDRVPLVGLKNLTWLDIRDTQLDDQDIKILRDALPNCKIIISN